MTEISSVEVFPVSIGSYRHHPDLDSDSEVRKITSLLGEYGGSLVPWDQPMAARDYPAVCERLDTWAAASTGNAFLYWVGHGSSTQSHASLAHAHSPELIELDGITPRALAYRITTREHNNPDSWAIVVIDACRSARFVELLNSEVDSLSGPRRLLLIGTSGLGAAALGEFRRALRGALRDTFAAERDIGLWRLGEELKARLPEHSAVLPKNVVGLTLRKAMPLPTQTTLDLATVIQAALTRLGDDERRHYLPKAQGGELGELAWYFEGRAEERRTLATWLRTAPSGLLVVTGRAGSGKSALLGNLLVHSRPELRDVLVDANLIDPLDATEQPPENAFTATIHLTGLTTTYLLKRIAADLALRQPDPTAPLTAQLNTVTESLRTRTSLATIMADGLDEAVDPLAIASAVLRPIAELPNVRLLIGTRRSTRESPDDPDPIGHDLLDALGAEPDQIVLVERDPLAIRQYIVKRLAAARLGTPRFAIEAAADLLSAAGGEFLFARLVVHELLADPALLTPGRIGDLVDLGRTTHRGVFARAVRRLSTRDPIYPPLLTALAYAQGRGLPMHDGIWATIGNAIAGGTEPVTNNRISSLLTDAAPYLTVDLDSGLTVYRLAHRTFTEHFTTDRTANEQRQLAIARRLVDEARPNPYLARYLSGHAGEGGQAAWQHLADHPHILDTLDPTAVTADAMRTAFGRFPLPAPIAGTIGAAHQLITAEATDRAGLRQLATTRQTTVDRPQPERHCPAWTVSWANLTKQPTHLTLTGHAGAVLAVAAFAGEDGRRLLATGGTDRMVRIWDPATGTAVGPPLSGHTGAVRAVAAFSDPEGNPLLATGGDDQLIRIWRLFPTSVDPPLSGHTGVVHQVVTFTVPDGRTLLATAGGDTTIRIWDPVTGTAIGQPLTGHTRAIWAVTAFTAPDGRTLLATGSGDATVRIWDPVAGAAIGQPLTGHTRAIWAITVLTAADGRPLLATGSDDDVVRVFDPLTGAEVGDPLPGHADWVWAGASFTGPAGRTLLATGSDNHAVRLWDPISGAEAGNALTGHTDWVWDVIAFPGAGGRPLLATASQDGTVRIWDPDTALAAVPVNRLGAVMIAVARFPDGRAVLATGSGNTVRIWDPDTGTELNGDMVRRTRTVRAIAAFRTPDGRALLATGDAAAIRIWDLEAQTEAGEPLIGHTGEVLAIAALPGADGRTLLAAGDEHSTIRVWDPTARTAVGVPLLGHNGPIGTLSRFPAADGRPLLLSTGSTDGKAWIWDPAIGSGTPASVPRNSLAAGAVVVSSHAGSVLLANVSHGEVQVWNPFGGTAAGFALTGHTGTIRAIASLSEVDSRSRLASAGVDGTVRIWDVVTGRNLYSISLDVPILSLAMVNDSHLAVGLRDGVAVLTVPALPFLLQSGTQEDSR